MGVSQWKLRPLRCASAKANEALSELGDSLALDEQANEIQMEGACPDLPPEDLAGADSGVGSGRGGSQVFEQARKKVELAQDSVHESVESAEQKVSLNTTGEDFMAGASSASAAAAAGPQACG